MSFLADKIADYRTRIGKAIMPPEPVPAKLTEQQLQERIAKAAQVLDMMATDGWRQFQADARLVIQSLKDSAIAVDPRLHATDGLEAKGKALGAQQLLNLVYAIVTDGQEAEKKLNESLRPPSTTSQTRRL